MGKNQLTILVLFFIISFSINSQNSDIEFGVKGGLNYSTYTSGLPVIEFDRALGYYIGGYGNFSINDKFKFQAEILAESHKVDFSINLIDVILPETSGESINPNVKGEIKELSISVPLLAQYYFTRKFYLELGPQMGFIIDKEGKIEESSESENGNNYDKFDFGLSTGAGFKITEKLGISVRYYFGIIERDDVKSSVVNVGISYKIL